MAPTAPAAPAVVAMWPACTLKHGMLLSLLVVSALRILWHDGLGGTLRTTTLYTTEEEEKGAVTTPAPIRRPVQLPHWRLAIECSAYHLDCFTTAVRDQLYGPYPFPFPYPRDTDGSGDEESRSDDEEEKEEEGRRVATLLERIPEQWLDTFQPKPPTKDNNNNNSSSNSNRNTTNLKLTTLIDEQNHAYLYPPVVSEEEFRVCWERTVTDNYSTMVQVDALLRMQPEEGATKDTVGTWLEREPDTQMLAFTIADYSYLQDMLHDLYQMMDEVVGFGPQNVLLVALDQKSVELACRYGYPVVWWNNKNNPTTSTDGEEDDENTETNQDKATNKKETLRDAVANTKIVLSHELVKRGIDFFFTEMDVWWIQSPKPQLIQFQQQNNNNNNDENHLYFSGHQNNYMAPNIGVYAVKANKYTEEYFRVCLDLLREKPNTHDQFVLQEVHNLFRHTLWGQPYTFGGGDRWSPQGPPKTMPVIQHPFAAKLFSPHEIVADERPQPTHQTLAIHTLNNAPLQMPHGKKMVAKELGVYFGFRTPYPDHPESTTTTHTNLRRQSSRSSRREHGGYYERSGGTYRKYLWLDGDVRSNFFSLAHPERYHDKQVLRWTMAILIAIARRTDRILVLPQIFNADMDAGTYFVWPIMDYSRVNELVDFRETNFISNPKAWQPRPSSSSRRTMDDAEDDEYWPFETVVNTGIFRAQETDEVSIYTQVSNRSTIISQQEWTATKLNKRDRLDAWIGSLSTIPELASAEVLLVNPDMLMNQAYLRENHIERFVTYKTKRAKQRKEEKDAAAARAINDTTVLEQSAAWKKMVPSIGKFEHELLEIYDLLRWCEDVGFRHTISKVSASDSCYGVGTWANSRY